MLMTPHISKTTRPLLTTNSDTEEWTPNRASGVRLVPSSSSAGALALHSIDASLTHTVASRNQRVSVLLPTPLIERFRHAIYGTKPPTLAKVITDAVTRMEQDNGGAFPPPLAPLKRGRPRRVLSPRGRPAAESERRRV